MERGRIVQSGTNADLVETPGRHARVWAAWTAG